VGLKGGEEATPAMARPERRGREMGEGRGPQGGAIPRGTPLNTVLQSSVKGKRCQRGGPEGWGVGFCVKGV